MRMLIPICLFVAAGITACGDSSPRLVQTGQCATPLFLAALESDVDELQIWPGNREGFARMPLLTIADKARIAKVKKFFERKRSGWYIPAKQSEIEPTRMATSEYTVKILKDGKVIAYIGWGYNYLETLGCGTEVVMVLPVLQRPALLNAVFGTPIPRYAQSAM